MNSDKNFLEILKRANSQLSAYLRINEPLSEIRQALRDCNSNLPATREFLESKRLNHIEELIDYLEATLNVERLKQKLNNKNSQT